MFIVKTLQKVINNYHSAIVQNLKENADEVQTLGVKFKIQFAPDGSIDIEPTVDYKAEKKASVKFGKMKFYLDADGNLVAEDPDSMFQESA